MTDRELMQMALDALEYPGPSWPDARQKAAEALHAALAQLEQEKTRSEKLRDAGYTRRPKGWDKDDGPEQEPVAWKEAPHRIYLQVCEDDICEVPFSEHAEVTWCQDKINDSDIPYVRADTAPPQREWVGLTDEEIDETAWPYFIGNIMPSVKLIVRQLEAKLKEKNT